MMKKTFASLAIAALLPLTFSCGGEDDGGGLIPDDGIPDDGIPDDNVLDDALDDIAGEICPDLSCKGVIEAGGSVSGIAEVDAFFSSVVSFNAQASALEAGVNATLGEMAAAIGVEAGANAKATADNIVAEVNAGFGGRIDGGISLVYEAPKCEVTAEATIEAAAKCDAEVREGSVEVECKGTCEAEASVMASCEGEATLMCTGTAPSFKCEGTCEGRCDVSAGAMCEGECKGTCELDGMAACDGECLGDESGGMCNGECKVRAGGSCSGTCKGTCELHAGGSCMGECKGECTYQAPEGGCEATAKASCTVEGSASVKCEGECKGEVVPPEVKAECEASAQAEANFSAECTPPSIEVKYELSAMVEGDASAEAQLEAELKAFAKAFAKLEAQKAKLDLVLNAGQGLGAAAEVAVKGALDSVVEADANAFVVFRATCGLGALGEATGLITGAVDDVSGSLEAVASVAGSVGS